MDASSGSLFRLALLGADPTTPAVVEAAQKSRQFTLAGLCEADEGCDADALLRLRALAPQLRRLDSWEALLDQQQVDCVYVARGTDEDRRIEQLRKLIQNGVPILVSHPVCGSMLLYYELDMIRRETSSIALPLLVDRHHPAVEQLADLVRQGADSPIGKVEQVVVQRSIPTPTKASVTEQFARDVDLIRAIAGDMTKLGSMASGTDDAAYSSLGIQMSSPRGIVARWSVIPLASDQEEQITLVGSAGRAIVDVPARNEPWSLEITGRTPSSREFGAWNPYAATLDQFARAIQGEGVHPDWVDASRSVELAETIERSLAKGRTIELYYEDYTEQGTFKGTMTSLGCGLLLVAMGLLGVVAILEQMGLPYLKYWPYLLLGTLGVFLLLQLLMLVFRQDEARDLT